MSSPDHRFALGRAMRARDDLDQALSGLGHDQRHTDAYVALEQAYKAANVALVKIIEDSDDPGHLRALVDRVDRTPYSVERVS